MADPGASSQPDPASSSESRNEEDDSEPKFQLTASLMKQIDPVTLHIQQRDETTMQAVQWFSNNVILILHTCDEKDYWAALEMLEPPTTDNQREIRDRPIIYPQIGSVIGWFAGYRAAVVRTGQGNTCRDGLMKALTKSFPNGRVIIGAGIGYANDRKCKFADVLISDQIENFVQYKKEGDKITNRGPREEIDPNVQRVFVDSARDWTGMKCFTCADNDRTSVAHIGCIVSAPTLIRDEVLRDQLMKHTPNAIGGEMEGWVLLELKKTLKEHNKHIEVIVIKGVADYGDLTKGEKWQWTAAKAAMDCIHYCLNKSGGIEFTGDAPLSQDSPESECVSRYAQYLKNRYEEMPTLPEGDWPPSLGRQYTRLAMIQRERNLHSTDSEATMKRDYVRGNIDRIVKRKKAVELPEIFLPTKDGKQKLKILMDGAPGVGKSTLSRKICKDWANGELLQKYHLVILLPLRQANIREATSIEDLIEADSPDLKQQVVQHVVQHIRRIFGEHVMLIVDGYDELSYEDRKKMNSLFLDIIQGKQVPKCSVLVTSRPYASGYLQRLSNINRHVEVLGFTDAQIEQCITVHENIPDKFKSELVQTLKERQDIASLCYIPLNCAIVLCVYEVEHFTLPNNLTKLYESFVLITIKRRITGNDSITTLAEVPESVQKHLNALSKLAYDGLVADKMVFSVKDIKIAFPNCSDLDNISDNLLSLMTVFKGFTSTGEELSYHFLHLTIQEFLAANWAASQLSASELLKFFQDHLKEDRYRMVLLFLAGISQLNFPSVEDLFRETLDLKGQDSRQYSNREVVDYFLFLAHLIYESQNFSLFHNLAGTIVGAELFTTSYHIAPFDCLVLAHFLALCGCSLKSLNLSNCGLTSESLEIIHKVNLEHCGTTEVEEVDLSNNPMVITKLSVLSKLQMFEHTKVLKACGLQCPVEASCVVDLLCLLNMRYLITLKVSAKALSSHFPPLDKIYFTLDTFLFENGNIDSQNAVGIFKLLEHNTSLEKLDLSENSQLAEGDSEAVGCAIERMLNLNRILKRLNLSNCGLDTAVTTSIFRSLEHNTSLEELDLSENNQLGHSKAVGCAIERMFSVNQTLKVLTLCSCELDTAVTTSIFRSLGHNTGLEELDLSENNLLGDSEAVGCAIERMLNSNRKLRVLNLQGCEITDPVAKHISTGLINSRSLVTLDIEPCTLSVGCAVSLHKQVVTHPTVKITVGEVNILGVGRVKIDEGTIWCRDYFGQVFHLSLNKLRCQGVKIDSQNAVDIFRSLEHNTILEELDLSGNSQLAEGDSEAVGCAIERMLNVNRTLKVLNLSKCKLDIVVATSIFGSLQYNTSLEKLHLSHNNLLGDSEAMGCAIERMLNLNRKLRVLNLQGCEITDPVAKHISTGLINSRSLVTLDIEPCTLSVGCAVSLHKQVVTHPTVKITVGEVNILGVGRVKTDEGTIWCRDYYGQVFHLSLNKLRCQGVKIDSQNAVDIFRSLEHNTILEELDLSGNSQLAEGDSEAVGCAIERMLNVNRTLKNLNLSGCNVTDPIAEHILTGLTKNTSLVTLDIESSKLSGSCAVSLFQQMATNPTLSITVGEVHVLGVGRVKMNRGTMIWCVISDLIPENCVEFFRALNNSGLKVSKLNVQDLTDRTAELFAVGLAESQCVSALKVSHNFWERKSITSAGAVSIFRSLEHNTSLEELDLSLNSQLAEGDSEAVGCAIERMLNVNKTVKLLNLYCCRLTNQVASYLANGLAQNHSVRIVILHSNNIGNTGAVSIFRSLEHNTSLEELDLSGNRQLAEGDSEAVGCVIERMLNVNGTLKVLNLSGCNLTDPIVKHILTGLTKNTSLVTLNVSSPKLSGSCAVALFQQMTTHPTLSITVGEVNVLGVGRVKMNRGTMIWCVISDLIPENCVEFFRALNNSGLKVSKLNVQDLTDQTPDHFAVGLAESRCVSALKLSHNFWERKSISSPGAVSIFRSLEHNTNLEELDLSGNSQLAEGDSEAVGCAIQRMLNVNRTLKVLNLNGCNVTDSIVKHILTGLTKNTSLVTLNVSSPILSVSCAVSLFQQMTTHPTLSITVGEVHVLGVGRVTMDGGTMIWCVISDLIPENCVEFFRALNNSGLKVSKLNVQDLTDQTADHFAVGLAESRCVSALKQSHNFWERKSISSPGAVSIFRSLEHNTNLEELDLSGNSQLAEGDSEAVGCAIQRMLNVNRTLKVLNLNGCNVTDSIVKHILTGLTKNTSLVTLNVSSPILSVSCAVSLFQQMTTHPTLSITVGEVHVLGVGRVTMDGGTMIWCVISDLIPENCVEFFRALNNSGLKASKLNVQDLTDQTADHFAVGLAESRCVSALKLSHNFWERKSISSPGAVSIFRSLEHNTNLEELDLSGNSQLAEGDSEAVGCAIQRMLNVNRTLKVLNLSDCGVTDPVVRCILTGLTKNTSLVTLNVSSPKLSSSCAVSLFQQMSTHPSLSITVGEVNVLGVGRVKIDRGGLWWVMGDLIPESCVEFFRALNSNGLMVSKLNVQDLTDQTAEHFAVGLGESQTVQALNFSHSFWEEKIISSAGAVSIFRSLEHNTSLEELDLSGNSQLSEGDSEAVGCAIERMVDVNRTLKVLNLSGCRLNTTVITHITAGLAHNASLAELKIGDIYFLSRNNITSEGWVHLFKALCNNTSLKKLNISLNELEMEGSVALAEMLSCNKSLTELNLRSCNIPKNGLREIAKGLLHNASLKKLGISCNKLEMEGSVTLAEMLSCNKSLTELNLQMCDIPEAGLREMARGMLQNTSLQTVTLWSLQQKVFLEAEIERLKKSGNFKSQSSSRLEIKTERWWW